jgi:cell filamentation protein
MYEAIDDPYCYRGTTVLRNRPKLRTQVELDKFEVAAVAERFKEPLPVGRLSYTHYRAIHRHIFRDVYRWAGRLRTVRITKGNSPFCYPEYIDGEMKKLFGQLEANNHLRDLISEDFARGAAGSLATLNAIHPFREGNGRTQNVFLEILADRAGHPLDFVRLNPTDMIQVMIVSFGGDERPLADLILGLMRVR